MKSSAKKKVTIIICVLIGIVLVLGIYYYFYLSTVKHPDISEPNTNTNTTINTNTQVQTQMQEQAQTQASDRVSFSDGFLDLSGNWYFNAYKPYSNTKNELDTIIAITPEVYTMWGMVQPGLDWWTGDFDSSLNGNPYFAGYAWYVRTFTIEGEIPEGKLVLSVGSFDESNEVYLNGKLIGSTGVNFDQDGVGVYDESNPWEEICVYEMDTSVLNMEGTNTVAVRMCNSSGGGGWYKGPIGLFTQEKYETAASEEEGRFILGTYQSPAVNNEEQTYRVYLPEEYDKNEASYPVLYLLHGINSSGKSYAIDKIDVLLDEAISKGEIEPMIVVLPDDPTKQSFWMNPYDDMVAKDLVGEIDKTYRTKNDANNRFIGGCSMGGGGAFHIASTNPDLFGGVISFYGALNMTDSPKSIQSLSDEQLGNMVFWMACGDKDMYEFYKDQDEMDKLLTKRGIKHYSEISSGEHNSDFYLPRFIQSIKYLQEESWK